MDPISIVLLSVCGALLLSVIVLKVVQKIKGRKK